MARRFPTQAKNIQAIGLSGSNQVRFQGSIPHGKARRGRDITMDIDARLILKIADAIRATSGHACCLSPDYCDLKTYENMFESGLCDARAVESASLKVGHAIWHIDNPDRPMPCRYYQNVIDIEASLPEGDTPPTFRDPTHGHVAIFKQSLRWSRNIDGGTGVYDETRCAYCARPVAPDAARLRTARTNDGEWWLVSPNERLMGEEWKDFQTQTDGSRAPTLLPIGPDCLADHPEFAFALAATP